MKDEFSYVVMMDEDRKLIMLVDDDLVNLQVGKLALSAMYRVLTVPSAEKMFTMLECLLDINMPDMDGFEAIRILKVSIIVKASGTRFDPALIRLFERIADQFIFSRDKP